MNNCQENDSDCLTIVAIIQITLRIVRIINNQSTTQPIAVLVREVTVIPICSLVQQESGLVQYPVPGEKIYRLAQCIESVQEALIRYYRTLGNGGSTVDEICVMLKDTVPMLPKKNCVLLSWHTVTKGDLTIEVAKSRDVSVSWSMTLIENS